MLQLVETKDIIKPRVKILRNVIPPEQCQKMREKFDSLIENGQAEYELDPKKLYEIYGIHEAYDKEQEELLFYVSKISRKNIVPSYNYARKYLKGSQLRRHSDREACEYSLTFNMAIDKKPWPFFCEVSGKEIKVDLFPGDLLYYTGTCVPHWREELEDEHCYQIFFHYVDADGPQRRYAFEGKFRKFKKGRYQTPVGHYDDKFDELE